MEKQNIEAHEISDFEWDMSILKALTQCSPREWSADDTPAMMVDIKVPFVVRQAIAELCKKWGINQGDFESRIFSTLVFEGISSQIVKAAKRSLEEVYIGSVIDDEDYLEEVCIGEEVPCRYLAKNVDDENLCVHGTFIAERLDNLMAHREVHCEGINGEINNQDEEASERT